jgi:hypothetical protein
MTTTRSDVLPDHLLGAILLLAKRASGKERFAFRSYDFKLQHVFDKLRRNHPILNAFVFSDTGPEPYSPALNESVSRLQLSGLIGRENPNYEVVFVLDSAEKFYEGVLGSEFAHSERIELEAVASEFLKEVDIV